MDMATFIYLMNKYSCANVSSVLGMSKNPGWGGDAGMESKCSPTREQIYKIEVSIGGEGKGKWMKESKGIS